MFIFLFLFYDINGWVNVLLWCIKDGFLMLWSSMLVMQSMWGSCFFLIVCSFVCIVLCCLGVWMYFFFMWCMVQVKKLLVLQVGLNSVLFGCGLIIWIMKEVMVCGVQYLFVLFVDCRLLSSCLQNLLKWWCLLRLLKLIWLILLIIC